MKYPHNVLYGGKFYKAGEEVPEPEKVEETSPVSAKTESVKEEPKTTKKKSTKKQ